MAVRSGNYIAVLGDNRSAGQQQIDKYGHPGKYQRVTTVNNTTFEFTGSNFAGSAVMAGNASADGTITLTGGGTVAIGELTTGVIYELSVLKVVESGIQNVYVFGAGI